MDVTVKMKVNGAEKTITTDGRRKLLDVLREEWQLTGTKYGCGEGQCGACLVLIDGKRAHSCLLPIGSANEKSITTIEGLGSLATLHPAQKAFIEKNAMQCGYCTSGMIISSVALLQENPNPTEEEIIDWMNGNICRCNGYAKILDAVHHASEEMRGERHGQ